MNIEFDQEPGEKSSKGGGSNNRLLLLVLLLLVAVFGYLFYFTDLIKPRQEAQAPEPVQTGQVKQPIPPRPDGQPSGAAPAE
ncbi:SPOR domain-containing protein, partial [bacterium]|nr:SPOR domain-containing protein [bacterium]